MAFEKRKRNTIVKIDPSYICFEILRTPVLDSSCCGLVTTEVGLETGGSRLRHYGYSIDMLRAYKNCGKLERKKNMAMVDYCSFTKVLNTFRKVHCSLYSLLVNYRSITVVSGIAYCLNSSKIDLL